MSLTVDEIAKRLIDGNSVDDLREDIVKLDESNVTSNDPYDEAVEEENSKFAKYLIETVEMQQSGELSSSGAKNVFQELYTQHQQRLKLISDANDFWNGLIVDKKESNAKS